MKSSGTNKVYYAAGVLLLFFAALVLFNTLFSKRDSVENSVTRHRTLPSEFLYDTSELTAVNDSTGRTKNLYFYAPVYDDSAYINISPETKENGEAVTRGGSLSPLDYAGRAREILRNASLPSDAVFCDIVYNETETETVVLFFTEVDGLKDYAFPTAVAFGEDRIEVRRYGYRYDRLGSVKIKEPLAAVYDLPFSESLIKLNTCELVYFFEDSIIQPAWLFKGTYSDGAEFSAFVRAADMD
jgi:hypothetical protein